MAKDPYGVPKMREIRYTEVSNVDTQMCVSELNQKLSELGIDNSDIISIQRQWNDKPIKIDRGHGMEDCYVTIFVFYLNEK